MKNPRQESRRTGPVPVVLSALALMVLVGLSVAQANLGLFIRELRRGEDGRATLKISPPGGTGQYLDIFATDNLVEPEWSLAHKYLRANGRDDLVWTEPEPPGPDGPRSRFFLAGRANVDLNENGIPDVREALVHVHDLPHTARARWARAGLGGPATNFTTVLNVKLHGATGNGTTDDSAAIAAVINQAPAAGSVVYLPAGTYRLTQPLYLKSNMILRGDGSALTSLVFDGSGTAGRCIGILRWDSHQSTSYATLTAGMEFGSSAITVSSVSGFQPNDIVEIEEDNDPAWGFNDAWQLRLPGQLNRIVAVDAGSRTLTLDRHLRHTFTTLRNARIRKLNTIENVGVEKLFIRRKDAVNGYTIEMKYAVRSWVKQVESTMTFKGHVWMDRSYECEVRKSFFHGSHVYGGGGQGYGVGCGKHTSDCLVEDNVFRHLRHSMIVGNGANGNVYGYNHSTDRAIDPVHGTPQADISVHGNYVFMNLFEGNVLEDADVPDWYWPAGPGNTLFRNRIVNVGTAIDVGSNNQNFLGNVLTRGSISKQSTTLEGIVLYGNVQKGDLGNVSWPGCPCQTLPDSLYRAVPPDFIVEAGVSWPPIGPNQPLDSPTPSSLRVSSGLLVP